MAAKKYMKIGNFGGVNRAISERDNLVFLKSCINFDTNVEQGKLVSRAGYASKVDLAAANIDQIYEYRDEEWGKDVLLVYDKNATVGSRKLYLYTRTSGGGGTYAQQGTYDYGSVELGERLGFLTYRGGVRIGTGTGANNKALLGKYYNRTGDNAMFNGNISFSGWFLGKQQWVQEADLLSGAVAVEYDATRERFYILTVAGLEVRDSNMHTIQVLDDVQAYTSAATSFPVGGVALNGDTLVVCGKVPGSLNSKIMVYDVADDFSTTASVTYTSTDEVYRVATDGTNIFAAAFVSAAYIVQKYSMTLTGTATIYTASGSDKFVTGLSADSTATTGYCYCAENNGNEIHKFLKDGSTAYDTTKLATTDDPYGVRWYSSNVYFIGDGDIRVTADTLGGAITSKKTGEYANDLTLPGGTPYALGGHFLHDFDNTTNFDIEAVYPGLVEMEHSSPYTHGGLSYTYFFGLSLVDIWGQESHLMKGFTSHGSVNKIIIRIRADYGLYDEQGLTDVANSYDPAQKESVWNNFRALKAVRIYRAQANSQDAAEPDTNYQFVKEIELTDANWVEETANKHYSFTYIAGSPDQSALSSVTFTESTGLPETFRPYYVNWQYAKQVGQFFYYANLRVDDLYQQRLIETPALSPDVVYLTDTNFADFGLGDGDEIQGLETSWNRLVVFKGEKSGTFSGLNQELVYQIGTNSPHSIVAWNNAIYFTYGSSIYAINPSGFSRISKPIDELLASEDLTTCVATVFKDKEKIWFLFPDSSSYLYNYELGTWDTYGINTDNDNHVFIITASDGNVLTANETDDKVFLQNTGTTDDGSSFLLWAETNDVPIGEGFYNAKLHRWFMTFTSSAAPTFTLSWRNENGSQSVSKSFPATTTNKTQVRFLNGVYGQHVSFLLNSFTPSGEVRIDEMGLEYSIGTKDRLQNA